MRQFGKRYNNKWVRINTKHGQVHVEEKLLRAINNCRAKNIPLTMPTTSAFYDAFRFQWHSPEEPTEKEWKLIAEVVDGVKIMTMNAPDAGRESDMEFERRMGGDQDLAMMKIIREAGGNPILATPD